MITWCRFYAKRIFVQGFNAKRDLYYWIGRQDKDKVLQDKKHADTFPAHTAELTGLTG